MFMPQQPILSIRQLYMITKQCWNMINERPTSSMCIQNFTVPGDGNLVSDLCGFAGYNMPINPGGTLAGSTGDTLSIGNLYINERVDPDMIGTNNNEFFIEACYTPSLLFSYLLERSMILASSCAISSQRSLQVTLNLNLARIQAPQQGQTTNYIRGGLSPGWRVSVFTEYSKVVSVFLDSCIVRS
jgi:hypothetical protein